MFRKIIIVLVSLVVLAVTAGALGYALNSAPVVAASTPPPANSPYVIKLHARWCPICMLTKGTWAKLESAYGDRARLVVFDFTSEATTEASRAEASRLGLDRFFAEHSGEPGAVYVLDGASKEVLDSFNGFPEFSEYATAIDAALKLRQN